jgi:hypothetical protein
MRKPMRFTCAWTMRRSWNPKKVKPGIVLDFNAERQVVGIEVLQLKRHVPKADLKQLKFEVA